MKKKIVCILLYCFIGTSIAGCDNSTTIETFENSESMSESNTKSENEESGISNASETPATTKESTVTSESTKTSDFDKTGQQKEKNLITQIDINNFIDTFEENITQYLDLTLHKTDEFSQNGYNFYEYTVDPSAGFNGCILDVSYNEDNYLQDVLINVPAGISTYFYATNAILAANPSSDYQSILNNLDVRDDGLGDDCTNVAKEDWGNMIFERKGDRQTFCIMFYN